MGGAPDSHGQGGHVVGKALGDGGHFLQALALGGGCAGDLVGGDAAYQAPAVIGVLPGRVGNVLLGDHLHAVEALLFHLLHGQVAGEHIAGVIQHDVQNTLALVRQLDGVHAGLGAGSGEDVSHHGDIHHALAHEAGDGGLMAGASLGDDGDAVSVFQGVVDDHVFLAPVNEGAVGGHQAVQQFVGQIVGAVDELLHFHGGVPPAVFEFL